MNTFCVPEPCLPCEITWGEREARVYSTGVRDTVLDFNANDEKPKSEISRNICIGLLFTKGESSVEMFCGLQLGLMQNNELSIDVKIVITSRD